MVASASSPDHSSDGSLGASQRAVAVGVEEQGKGRALLADLSDNALVNERLYFSSLDLNKGRYPPFS